MTFSEISQLTRNQSCGVSVLSFLLAFCHDAITTRFVSRRNHRCSLKLNGIAALGAPPRAWRKILFPSVHVKVTILKTSSNYKAVRNDCFSFLFSFLTHFAARIYTQKNTCTIACDGLSRTNATYDPTTRVMGGMKPECIAWGWPDTGSRQEMWNWVHWSLH
jgi:hypothetical protein